MDADKTGPPPYEMQQVQEQPQQVQENLTVMQGVPGAIQASPVKYVQVPQQQWNTVPVPAMQPALQVVQQPAPAVHFVQPQPLGMNFAQPVFTKVSRGKNYYLTLSAVMNGLCFVCCCCWAALPCTILALVFSIIAQQLEKDGKPEKAKIFGNVSLALNISAIVFGIITFLIYIIVIPAVTVTSAQASSRNTLAYGYASSGYRYRYYNYNGK